MKDIRVIKKKIHHLLILTLFMINGCGTYTDIFTSADAETDFSKYQTFAWLPDQADSINLPHNNEIIRNNIRNYFGHAFAERGYKVNLDTPDVLLKILIVNRQKEKLVLYDTYPLPYYYRRYYYGSIYHFPYHFDYYYRNHTTYCYPPECTIQKIEYLESSITLNVIDRKKNKLVWSGTAMGDIYDPDYINRNIHPAVEAIMKKYPVKEITKTKKTDRVSPDIYN